MDVDAAILARRSVRDFTAEPIDHSVLRRLIDAAVHAPSAVDEQPWLFSVIRNKDVLATVSHEAKSHMQLHHPEGFASEHLAEILKDPTYDVLHHAPVLIVIASRTRGAWAVENCALAAENLMLSAYAAGLGTCWIGFAQGWLATPMGKSTVGLPQTSLPVAPIIIGHPKAAPPNVPRKDTEVHWIE